jgi:hypothetical protein
MMPKSAVRRLLTRLDRIAGEMNELPLVLGIGLGCFYLSVVAILDMAQQPDDRPDYHSPDAAVADAVSAYLPRPE